MIKEISGWKVTRFYFDYTYEGLYAGNPRKKETHDCIIKHLRETVDKLFYKSEVDNLNIFLKYKEGEEFLLKPVRCMFEIMKEFEEVIARVITYAEFEDSIEDVVKSVVEENLLKVRVWTW